MVFNLVFAKNAVLLCLHFFFLTINLHFLITSAIAQLQLPTKEEKVEIETDALTVEAKISKYSINLKSYKNFLAPELTIHYALFL